MKFSHGARLARLMVAFCCVFLVTAIYAQVPNSVSLVADGSGGSIVIDIDLDVGGVLPTEWVGWVVDRSTIGNCDEPTIQLGETTPFPGGEGSYVLNDVLAEPGTTYKYRIFAVDADGVRHYLPGYTEWSPGYYQFDYASLWDQGYVAEGQLVDLGWTAGIEICQDYCWEYLSFISELPEELMPYVGTSATVQLIGEIDAEFEGPYITQISSWSIVSGCSSVSTAELSWSGLKALYR